MTGRGSLRDQRRRTRRLALVVGVVFLGAGVAGAATVGRVARRGLGGVNPVVVENRRRGSRAWRIRLAPRGTVAGYSSEVSVAPGGTLHLHVSTSRPLAYRVEVYRIGWYGGTGGRLVACVPGCRTDRVGVSQPVPPPDRATGLLRLSWPVTDPVPIGDSWVSGYYLANLVVARGRFAGRGTFVPFIVRAPTGRNAVILVQAAVNTWQAYNRWGGRSLYWNHTGVGDDHVSFDRPYDSGGAPREGGRVANLPQAWEFPLARFLERYGYDVSYTTDVDTDRDPGELLRHRLVMTAGHDEYWTKTIRDAMERARRAGVNLAFMGANTGYWQMRYANDRRTIIEYRTADRDPEPNLALKTVRFRELATPRPECTLTGVQWGEIGNADYTAVGAVSSPPDPWFTGTGLQPNDVLPGLVGYEYDSIYDTCKTPPLTQLFKAAPPNHLSAYAIRYIAASGANVFASGSIRFATRLDPLTRHGDPRLQRFMRNALKDLTSTHH